MNIILIDTKADLAKKHAAALTAHGHKCWYWNVSRLELCDGNTLENSSTMPASYELALVHQGDVRDFEKVGKGCPRVVIYSGGGNPKETSCPGIKRPVGIDSPIPDDALRRICELASEAFSETNWHKGIEGLFNEEPLLAFRLLCEATKAVGKANIKRKLQGEATSNTIDLSGITIHAPSTLDEWRKPFAKTEQSLPTIEQVAAQIASGPVKTEVENVLKAVGKAEELVAAIDKFEQEFAKQQAALKAGSKL